MTIEKALTMYGVWHEDLQCYLKAIVLPDTDKVDLYFPADNCCDMSAAVDLAKSIIPRVARIETFAGDKADNLYARGAGGEWKVIR